MAFDNLRVNTKLLKTKGIHIAINERMSVYFNSFHRDSLKLVDFDPFWFLFPIHKVP